MPDLRRGQSSSAVPGYAEAVAAGRAAYEQSLSSFGFQTITDAEVVENVVAAAYAVIEAALREAGRP